MKNSYFKALGNIMLGIMSPFLSHGETTVEKVPSERESGLNLNLDLSTRNKSPMLILKPSEKNSGWEFFGHRSHQSHRSHRSHYSSSYETSTSSSSSSSSGTYNQTNTTTYTPYKYTPTKIEKISSSSNGITLTHPKFKLGDRTIEPYFEGTDVTEMIQILQKKGYIIIDQTVDLNEESKYEGVLIPAVKEFQKDYALTSDGIVGPNTIKQLLK